MIIAGHTRHTRSPGLARAFPSGASRAFTIMALLHGALVSISLRDERIKQLESNARARNANMRMEAAARLLPPQNMRALPGATAGAQGQQAGAGLQPPPPRGSLLASLRAHAHVALPRTIAGQRNGHERGLAELPAGHTASLPVAALSSVNTGRPHQRVWPSGTFLAWSVAAPCKQSENRPHGGANDVGLAELPAGHTASLPVAALSSVNTGRPHQRVWPSGTFLAWSVAAPCKQSENRPHGGANDVGLGPATNGVVGSPFAHGELVNAAAEGNLKEVKPLLAGGSNIEEMEGGCTPLAVAVLKGHEAVVKFLLGKGAHVNHVCENGATPLYLAAQNGYASIAHILIDQGANVNQATEGGTPLYAAVEHNNLPVARLLLDNGANIHTTGSEGVYPASVFVCPASVFVYPASVFVYPASVFVYPASVFVCPASVFVCPASVFVCPASVSDVTDVSCQVQRHCTWQPKKDTRRWSNYC